MGVKTDELISILEAMDRILSANGEATWSQWIKSSRDFLAASDSYGIDKLLSAYGGMGSINDLHISHNEQPNYSLEQINAEFSNLRSRAWKLASQIKTELNNNSKPQTTE